MFDIRYHVASLAAVFLALAIGLLLGVAISGKVSGAQDAPADRRIDQLSEELAAARERADALERQEEAAEELAEEAYPVLVDGRLAGREVALVFLGPVDGRAEAAVERALEAAGAGGPARVIALRLPLDAAALAESLGTVPPLAADGGGEPAEVGRALARELLEGGETPLLSALASVLVEERAGSIEVPVDAAVVVASWAPPADGVEDADRVRETQALLDGLLRGLDESGLPVVGVETTGVDRSTVDRFRATGVSSVDNVDTLVGRLALALVLAGADAGHYGTKESADDGAVPPIEPVLVSSEP